jgi:mRNA-degrading endonuclease RelE of RelBE toxin-antitoxin system
MADAWDHLSETPDTRIRERCYPLQGSLGHVPVNGVELEQWQYKPTKKGDVRIWYAVDRRSLTVHVLRVATNHPNETK